LLWGLVHQVPLLVGGLEIVVVAHRLGSFRFVATSHLRQNGHMKPRRQLHAFCTYAAKLASLIAAPVVQGVAVSVKRRRLIGGTGSEVFVTLAFKSVAVRAVQTVGFFPVSTFVVWFCS
jgi:hypothetical protein